MLPYLATVEALAAFVVSVAVRRAAWLVHRRTTQADLRLRGRHLVKIEQMSRAFLLFHECDVNVHEVVKAAEYVGLIIMLLVV